jgi:hypothetical protein
MSDKKTRAELLEMLAEAVRNTQPHPVGDAQPKPDREAQSKRKRKTQSCSAKTKQPPGASGICKATSLITKPRMQ